MAGLKLLLTVGGWIPVTFKVALAGVVLLIFVPPPVDDNSPAGIVLMRLPVRVEVTLTDIVHDPGVDPDCAGTVPPVKDKVALPSVALTEPPQLLVKPAGVAMTRPGWTPTKLSVQEALVSENPFGLKTVTLKRDVPPAGIEIGEKLLFISAGREICAWAYTVCAGIPKMETISTITRRGVKGFRILSL